MPESEKRELGGLARSIDALFSQARPAPPADASETEPDEDGVADALDGASEPGEASGHVTAEVEPDPFEPLDAHTDLALEPEEAVSEPEAPAQPAPAEPEGLSFADVEVPQEVVWESVEVEEVAEAETVVDAEAVEVEEAETVLDVEAMEAPALPEEPALVEAESEVEVVSEPELVEPEPAEPEAVEPPPPPQPEGPPGAALAEAVAAYLAGEQGAADEVRAVAASLQERLALDPLADAVETLVHSGDDAPGQDAIALAREVIDPAVASRLVQRMGHEDDDDRRAGYVVLAQRLGSVMARAFRGALTDKTDPRSRRAFYDALIAMGDDSRPMIEAMVEDDNRFLVRNAVAMLGEIGGDRAEELVTSTLANTDPRVRREALSSLAKIGGEEAGQLVTGFLEDPDAAVRAAAAEAAGALKVERALRPILGLLDDEDDPERLVQLLHGLGRLGDPGAVQAIEKRAVGSLFSKPVTEVRVAAYHALNDIGTPHAKDVIAKAREDKDPVVRTTARALATDD